MIMIGLFYFIILEYDSFGRTMFEAQDFRRRKILLRKVEEVPYEFFSLQKAILIRVFRRVS